MHSYHRGNIGLFFFIVADCSVCKKCLMEREMSAAVNVVAQNENIESNLYVQIPFELVEIRVHIAFIRDVM